MVISEEMQRALLQFPGARRAANGGVLLPLEDGGFYHVQDIVNTSSLQGLTANEQFFAAFCSRTEILRLRELRNGHDYLLRLRANALVDSPRGVRVMRARRQAFESSGRPWSLSAHYHAFDAHHKSYISLLSRAHQKQLRSLPCGMAWIPEMNAMCVRSLAGDMIVASENLEHFYHFMTLGFFGADLGVPLIDQLHALLIAARIARGSEAADFDIDPRGQLDPPLAREIHKRVRAQMQFTFGHEFAHLLRGHLEQDDIQVTGAGEARTYAHALEFEADEYAIRHIEHDREARAAVASSATTVMLYLEFLNQIADLCGMQAMALSGSHPTPLHRLQRLHAALGKLSPLAGASQIDALIEHTLAMAGRMRQFVEQSPRADIMTFHGSAYLPSYRPKQLRDRIDF
ncbi:hypothetical protein [Stenotrophomonas sp. NRRL B-14846]|uniref:hypothetical protein n=1 Tax=Stenotrophomonas sp. NRRL B-14846 TaxID=3162882 RepID=UPI003D2C5AC1